MPVPSETIILLSVLQDSKIWQQSVVCRLAIINTMKPEVTQLIFAILIPTINKVFPYYEAFVRK